MFKRFLCRPLSQFGRLQLQCRQYRRSSYNRFQSQPSFNFNTRTLAYIGAGVGAFYFYNQDYAPFTNRSRLLWVPYWLEKKIGDLSYGQILAQYRGQVVPHLDPLYGRISKIIDNLLSVAYQTSNPNQVKHLKSLDWQIHVIKVNPLETPPNAFILPNGKIFIFSSILPICQDTNGLATVLSHELSHQLAHHSMEQLSKQPFYIALSMILYTITGVNWVNDLVINGVLTMPASREMESEADRIGCELMARACYDLHGIPKFWQRMEAFEQKMAGNVRSGLLTEFFSTHPNTTKRISDIQRWMPDLVSIQENSNCHQFSLFQNYVF